MVCLYSSVTRLNPAKSMSVSCYPGPLDHNRGHNEEGTHKKKPSYLIRANSLSGHKACPGATPLQPWAGIPQDTAAAGEQCETSQVHFEKGVKERLFFV